MSKYSLQELLKLWQQERLKVEQAIGQILQHLLAQEKEINELKRLLPKSPPNRAN